MALRTPLLLVVLAAALWVVVVAPRGPDSALPAPPPLHVPFSPDAAVPADPAAATLDAIAHCESRGDPAAVSADGVHRGKYQFDRQTWASVGGSGDPAAAPEAEQDRRAAALMARAGANPWPVCGS